MDTAISTMAKELVFLLEEADIRKELQAALANAGCRTFNRFAGLDTDTASVRKAIAQILNLDASASVQDRFDIGDLSNAWLLANKQSTKEAEIRAEARATDSSAVKPLNNMSAKSLRAAYEATYGKIADEEVPSRYLLGTKMEQVLEGEPRIEELVDITTADDQDEDFAFAEATKEGLIRVVKGKVKKAKPVWDTETLRARHQILNNAWMFVAIKHTSRPWLADLTSDTFARLSKFLLGKTVQQLESEKDAYGRTHKPSWSVIMKYERAIRKLMYKKVGEGYSMDAALQFAMKDAECRQIHFTTPWNQEMILQQEGAAAGGKPKGWKGGQNRSEPYSGKATGQNKGGKGKQFQPNPEHSQTPQGDKICYAFNNQEGCDGSCGMKHVCQRCFGDHDKWSPSCPINIAHQQRKGKGKNNGKKGKAKGGKGRK